MTTYIETFKRREEKYVLDALQVQSMRAALEGHMEPDQFGKTRIDSLYYDTPNRDLIARSIEKPLYKEKLRVRSYGDITQAQAVFIELKKKYKGVSYKRRMRLSQEGAMAYFDGMSYEEAQFRFPIEGEGSPSGLDAESRQIAHEIDAFFRRYENLQPSMLITCVREAWCPSDDGSAEGVRITFDEHLAYLDLASQSTQKRQASSFRSIVPSNTVVMEIKCAGAYPLWLVEALTSCRAYPQSFSKYGMAYQLCHERRQPSRKESASNSNPVPANGQKLGSTPRHSAGYSAGKARHGYGAPAHARGGTLAAMSQVSYRQTIIR